MTNPLPSTFALAKVAADALDEAYKAASAALATIPGAGSGPMGLTPDAVKASPEWKAARAKQAAALKALQAFNLAYSHTFAREIRADRDARRAARLASSVRA